MDIKIDDNYLHEASHLRLQAHYGKVYIYKNKRVFRGINDDKIEEILQLMNSGLIEELVNKKLFPKTNIANVQLKEYKLVIEHEKIPLRNMFLQWSFEMLKDSAKTTLLVNEIANKYGYEIRDAHFLNTMFFYGKSIFIDLDSFVVTRSSKWVAYEEFINSYMKLLQLMSLDDKYEYQESIKGMAYYIPNEIYQKVIPLDKQYNLKQRLSIKELKEDIEIINLKNQITTWSNYHDNFESDYDLNSENRVTKIIQQIKQYNPKNIIDLASNAGMFANIILNEISSVKHVVCIDKDHSAINKLFHNIGDKKITPLYNDIVDDYYLVLSDRPKADMVLALALTHHLLLSSSYDIDFIFELIGSFGKKNVLIEFMPLGLYGGDLEKTPPVPSWYTEEWFQTKFCSHFKLLYKEKIEINRILFVGEILSK
ncbi:MAG: hypothetical protein C0626_12775 [Arcobacter sp.]|uniref:hypothetical protein n=1 Tax=uncultured Arcobacter sp. TaxID=165434 RepID=UPI000CC6F25B|nr:hypothetical protein [uncultured Arcobacter sp.]PLY08716.1 MAG: hypothetical protein C0626_12775 [Arcobacter sp.]